MKRETRDMVLAQVIGAVLAMLILGCGIVIWEVLR